MTDNRRLKIALFILRISLGIFLAIWALNKIVEPQGTAGIFRHFYHADVGHAAIYVMAMLELALALAIASAVFKTASYGVGLLVNAVSVLSTYEQLLHPFGRNDLFVAGIPVLAGFVILFLLRHEDRWLAFDKS